MPDLAEADLMTRGDAVPRVPCPPESSFRATALPGDFRMATGAQPMQIDESLYSRQLYVLGHDAMRRMAEVRVLLQWGSENG